MTKDQMTKVFEIVTLPKRNVVSHEHDYFFSIFFSCTIGGQKKLGQTSNLYKVKIQKYTLCKFGFLQIRL
jgi:hypothetical protein